MRYELRHGEIIRARVESVYPTLADGSVSLVHSDGPYNLGKAAWDKVPDLAAFYRPHIAEWGRVCAASASVYLWNTAEGWAAVHPEMVAQGWEFRGLIIWNKKKSPESIGHAALSKWIDITEVCGHYTRGEPPFHGAPDAFNVWEGLLAQFPGERLLTGETWRRKAVGPDERVPLHPCQKPLLFARRIIEASTRPGDLLLEPFAGTARIAVACEQIARYAPEEARRYVCVEQDEDGRDYVGAVLRQLGALPEAPGAQPSLFAPRVTA